MTRRWFAEQFDERMRAEADEIKKAMEDLIIVIGRAELEVANALKELEMFMNGFNKK